MIEFIIIPPTILLSFFLLGVLLHKEKYKLYAYSETKKGVDAHAFVSARKEEFIRAPESDKQQLPDYYAVLYRANGAEIILYISKGDAEHLV
jgi:hypothetical protein